MAVSCYRNVTCGAQWSTTVTMSPHVILGAMDSVAHTDGLTKEDTHPFPGINTIYFGPSCFI